DTTTSKIPSLLKSPTVNAPRLGPGKSPEGESRRVRVPSPLFNSSVTVPSPIFSVTKSTLPSPLKSPLANEYGLMPTATVVCGLNMPSPLPSKIDTVLSTSFASARSILPSPLKSAASLLALITTLAITPTLIWAQGYLYNRADFPTGNSPAAVVAADFNRDGRLDLAVVNEGDNTVSILLGIPSGTFGAQMTYAAGSSPTALVVA